MTVRRLMELTLHWGRFLAAALVVTGVWAAAAGQTARKGDSMHACLTDSMVHIFPDSDARKTGAGRAVLDVARGGTAAVHVLINHAGRQGQLEFAVRCKGRRISSARWYRLIDVPVEVNTGPFSFVETKGELNPHVIRRAPFRVYDAMQPVSAPIPLAGETMALRLEISIARSVQAGRRTYDIDVASAGRRVPLTLTVIVHKARIPPVGKNSLPYTNWFSLARMAKRHGLKIWSEAHWDMIGRYARLMVRARQNTFWVPWQDIFHRRKTGLVLNRERLRRIVRTFTDAGMYYIEGGTWAPGRGAASSRKCSISC